MWFELGSLMEALNFCGSLIKRFQSDLLLRKLKSSS